MNSSYTVRPNHKNFPQNVKVNKVNY